MFKKAFTIVELIVVITILAILSTIAFISLSDYTGKSKDAVRMSDLKNIQKVLQLYETKNSSYPEPDLVNGKSVFGETAFLKVGKLNSLPKDPNGEFYFYELSQDGGYKLKANLENGEEFVLSISGDGKVALGTGTQNIPAKVYKNCKEIKDDKPNSPDGEYSISPNGTEFIVYCDMTTTGGGWTRYLNIKSNYSFADAKTCFLGSVSNANIDCFNPNRFDMQANEFMAKQTVSGTKTNYFFTNNSPEPSFDSKTSNSSNNYKCLGGNNYMIIMKHMSDGKDILSDGSNSGYVFLGLSFCKYSRGLGAIGKMKTPFMNYSSSARFGPNPGKKGREADVNPVEIYIK
ncbi:hypothetical protein DLH72_00875 [Candidatus Gracilibacteria bacterium]|nr:MAG: hypothetical protein DLH72_00875 [Candidatus Gracilibacteria bacterium]